MFKSSYCESKRSDEIPFHNLGERNIEIYQ